MLERSAGAGLRPPAREPGDGGARAPHLRHDRRDAGRREGAARAPRQSHRDEPDRHQAAPRARARLNVDENRLADAIADYASVVAIAPSDGTAWNNKAWLEVLTGDFAAARADADRAVQIEANAYHLGTRCFALVGLGELALASADCAKAVELKPDDAEARGVLAFIEKRYADARREWEEAIAEAPRRARELKPWLAKLPR